MLNKLRDSAHFFDRKIGLIARDDERRAKTDGVPSRSQHQQSALERHLLDAIANLRGAVFGRLIVHQLKTDHQPQTPDVADMPESLRPLAKPVENVTADFRRVRDQFAFK